MCSVIFHLAKILSYTIPLTNDNEKESLGVFHLPTTMLFEKNFQNDEQPSRKALAKINYSKINESLVSMDQQEIEIN